MVLIHGRAKEATNRDRGIESENESSQTQVGKKEQLAMKKLLALSVVMIVLAVGVIGLPAKADDDVVPVDGGCQSGTTVSENCVSEYHCVVIDGHVYEQITVCCHGNCFVYLEAL